MQEKELIKICKKHVEQKFSLSASQSWKQRDFEYLSDLLFEKTHVRLSVSTLKRLWKEYDVRIPQTHTLNTLAISLDYESWNDFRLRNLSGITPDQTVIEKISVKKVSFNRKRILILAGIAALLLASYYFIIQRPKIYEQSDIVFKSKKSISSGVPNTVVFEYDISKLDFDSAFIQHSWDKRMRAKISKDNHFQTFIYYYPGYHTAKLIINNQIVKLEKVNITTTGWEALVEDETARTIPYYIPKKDIIENHSLYVSRETLIKNDIPVKDKKFFVHYFNVGNFKKIDGANFTLDTKIKNRLEDGAFVCQYSQVTLLCENGRISIPLCAPGCEANIHLHIGEVFKEGKKNDLTAFGIDLSNWRDIKIECKNKKIDLFVDGNSIYKLNYQDDLGKITGFDFSFYGNGAVDYIHLYNQQNEIAFSDTFGKSNDISYSAKDVRSNH